MNYDELVKIIDKVNNSSVAYVEFNQGTERIIVAKEVPKTSFIAQESAPLQSELPAQSTEILYVDTHSPVASSSEEVILSPLVGVVYLQPKPNSAPFVKVGDTVTKGQTVCIIEAMKLMNEIVAPVSGVISEIIVENEMVVEFEQPIMKIEMK